MTARRHSAGLIEDSTAPAIVHEVLRSPGRPLDAEARAFMEPRFGHSFDQVRIHADARAANAASAIDARAFTLNRDIVFGAGEYSPRTEGGRRLLSHELMHVTQQRGASSGPLAASDPLVVGEPDNRSEVEASRAASEVTLGGIAPSPSLRTSKSVIRRQPVGTDAPKGTEDSALTKGREELDKLAAEYKEKIYTRSGKEGDFDPEALKDAAAVMAGLTIDGQKYLRSEAGAVFLKGLLIHPSGHALALFSKAWTGGEAAAKEALENKDGQAQVLLLVGSLIRKTYSSKGLLPEQESKPESTGPADRHSGGDYDQWDPAAVKDCFAIVGKLTDEARRYLKSEAGKVLLNSMELMPEGHALRLFKMVWRASAPVVTKAQRKEAKQLETLTKHFGKELGKPVYELLKENASAKSLGDQVKGGVKPTVNAFVKLEKEQIEAYKQLNDPNYTTATAEQDIKDLEKIKELITGIEDDALKLRPVTWLFGKARDAVMNPLIPEGLLIALTNPTAVKTIPGAENTSTPAEYIINTFMNKKAEQKIPVSFGKSTSKFQGGLAVGTNAVTPSRVLSGEDPLAWGMVKKLSGDLTGRFGTENRPLTVTAKDEFTFPPPGASTPASLSSKGSAEVDFKNKKTEKSFTGKANYEFKPGALTLSGSQKFADKKDSITFSEGYAEDQNGTKTTFGVDVKSSIFKQRLNLNLPRNAGGKPINETASLGVGVQFPKNPKEKSKTLSLDADITLNLAGNDYVKALSSFLEYKDPKDFLNAAIGYQRERGGQIQKEDFALALKKTWDDVSFYLGASFGMNAGNPARGDFLAGTEIMFGSKSKYGGVADVEYNRSGLPGTRDTFTASVGLVRDKLRLAAYLSNNPANQFGVKGSATFDPSAWIKKKR